MTVFFYIFMRAQAAETWFFGPCRKKKVDFAEISTIPLLPVWADCRPGLRGPMWLFAKNPHK
jgi:hypothetical protein